MALSPAGELWGGGPHRWLWPRIWVENEPPGNLDQRRDGRSKACEESGRGGWGEEAVGREGGQCGGCGPCFGLRSGSTWKPKEQMRTVSVSLAGQGTRPSGGRGEAGR